MHKKLLVLSCCLLVLLLIPSLSFAFGNKALQNKLDQCREERASLENENQTLQERNLALENRVDALENEKVRLEQRITELEAELEQWEAQAEAYGLEPEDPTIISRTVEETLSEKNARIVRLEETIEQKDAEIEDLRADNQSLQSQVQELQSQEQSLRRELGNTERRLRQVNQELEELRVQNALYERQIADLEQEKMELAETLDTYEMVEQEARELQEIALGRIQEVLREEIEAGDVRVFKGSLGITLDIVSSFMFNSGSVRLNPKGRTVLGKIAGLLDEFDGYFIGIIGNADSQPIVGPSLKAKYPTNWELSAVRGAVVVRFLLDNSSVSPSRMVAMGLGEYQPIDDNVTEQGRGNNRRIDIVLLPMDVLATVAIGVEVK
jgi:chemotaxis protein MotB